MRLQLSDDGTSDNLFTVKNKPITFPLNDQVVLLQQLYL